MWSITTKFQKYFFCVHILHIAVHGGGIPSIVTRTVATYQISEIAIFLLAYIPIKVAQCQVHKIENFFDSDFGICVISLIVMSKY
jgi:hypothetical protein